MFAFTANAKQSSLVARELRSYWMHPRSRMLVAKNIAALPGSTRFSNAVNQHLEKDEAGMWKCKLCGKTANTRQHLKNHIETHLDGLSFPCELCGKTFRSRNALFIHNTRYHK